MTLSLMLVMLGTVPVRAQDVASAWAVEPEARQAISSLWSPFCPGRMLEVCPSPNAAALRDSIQAMAVAGLRSDEIVERVLATYGEDLRARPRLVGMGLWAWVLPWVFFAGALGLVITIARSRSASAQGAGLMSPVPSADDQDRVNEALRKLDATEGPDW